METKFTYTSKYPPRGGEEVSREAHNLQTQVRILTPQPRKEILKKFDVASRQVSRV